MQMDDSQLDAIENRLRLWVEQGDRDAFRLDDALALMAETREARADRRHLVAMTRQNLDQIAALKQRAGELELQAADR